MRHDGVDDPYNQGYRYYRNHYLCLWEVTEEEIVGHYVWNDFDGDRRWYENIVLPAFKAHEQKRLMSIRLPKNPTTEKIAEIEPSYYDVVGPVHDFTSFTLGYENDFGAQDNLDSDHADSDYEDEYDTDDESRRIPHGRRLSQKNRVHLGVRKVCLTACSSWGYPPSISKACPQQILGNCDEIGDHRLRRSWTINYFLHLAL
ncbi:uncharacterized protein Z518_10380 [Rhinocladiella mackenziei CBS 650.93]|uniref:Uncharacterized protein n=1 Tax=Rhinocladiella mackenziei CBS 650.93 TaxID=1442369 RepID=A0A0D2IAG9_9EURO|nr:uncharacterized protein Z518_10380 [Rhinocladiella mackenziei CBS 650.93]KIX00241.1 hypothetical protein Z518_10380 [Rhinocladiella mackenziei CBS 650.93]